MSERRPIYEGTPFREPLVDIDSPTRGDIVTLPSYPDIIIRNHHVWHHPDRYISSKGLFEELRDVYGIKIPKFQYVIGAGRYPEQVFVITERIHGQSMGSWGNRPIPSRSELEGLCVNLIRYFQDVHEKGKFFLSDISIDQFMYGHRSNETKDSIFLIDLGPMFEQYHPDSGSNSLFLSAQGVLSMIIGFERDLNTKLSIPRENLKTFLSKVHGVHPNQQETVDLLLKRLGQ